MTTPTPEPYLVKGVKLPEDHPATYPRLEIRDLVKKPKQFTWFILGWLEIRNPEYKTTAASFLSQGGIHGLPYKPWEGDPAGVTPKDNENTGYCNHASVLFPTWHRPSILLLEQAISEAVFSILPKYITENTKNKEEWKAAAVELRFPYWDWTHPDTGKEGLPKILRQEKLQLELPDGTIGEIENILAFYYFGKQTPAGFTNIFEQYQDANDPKITRSRMAYFKDWERTYRWPSANQQDPKEDYTELNNRLKGTTKKPVRGSWRELTNKVALLFNFPETSKVIKEQRPNVWDEFSNTRFQSAKINRNTWIYGAPNWKCGSIEQPHNTVHLVIGGTGHMMDNDYAGFDPIFYLHHCNIDRIVAFWEHVYPDYWMGDGQYWTPRNQKPGRFTDQGGKYGVPENSPVGGETPLTPFRKEDGSYWTSNDLRWGSTGGESMSYTYPPISDPLNPWRTVSLKPVDAATRDAQAKILKRHFEHGIRIDSPKSHIVSIQLDPFAFESSYTVEILYAAPSGELEYIASAAALTRSPDTQCAGCQARREEGAKSENIILIPEDVVKKIEAAWAGGDATTEEILKQSLRAQIAFPAEGGIVGASSKTRGTSYDPHSAQLASAATRGASDSKVEVASVRLDLKENQKPKIQLHSRSEPLHIPRTGHPSLPGEPVYNIPSGDTPDNQEDLPESGPHWKNHGIVLDDWF